MKLIVKDDFRKFTAGDEFVFTTFDNERENNTDVRLMYIVGPNGAGKSTIMKTIRQLCKKNNEREKNIMLSDHIKECSTHIELEGFGKYEYVIALDSEMDDNMHMGCSASADMYVENGGYKMRYMSNGMRSAMTYVDFINNHKDKIVPGKTLVLLDEVDKGWMIEYTTSIYEQLKKNLAGCDIIMISHNPLCWLSCWWNKVDIYDIETKEYTTAEEYFHKKTGLYMKCSFIDYEKLVDNLEDKINKLEDKIKEFENNKE